MVSRNIEFTGALATLATLLTGCGGGGSSSTVPSSTLPYTASALVSFSDGAGIAKLIDKTNDSRIYVAAPDIGDLVTEVNSNGLSTSPDTYVSDLTIMDTSLPHADYGTATITVGGQTANVDAFVDRTSESVLMAIVLPVGGQIGLVGDSSPLSGLPSGAFTYVGTEVVSPRTIYSPEVGTFSMSANFDTNLVSYSGSTPQSSMVINNMALNPSTGDFAGSNGTFTALGSSGSATMYGSFSGTGADGVSGVYHTNDADGTFIGGFIGHRQ